MADEVKRERFPEIEIGDTIYELTPEYVRGAQDARGRRPHWCNPYRYGTQSAYDWDEGYTNECEDDAPHVVCGINLIDWLPDVVGP